MYHAGLEAFLPASTLALSPLERSVVFLSRNDPLSSVPGQKGFRAWIGRHFGGEPVNELADPKLEALRRLAVVLRQDAAPSERVLRDFLLAGYTRAHADLVARIARQDHRPRKEGQPSRAQWAILLLLAFGAFAVVQSIADQMPVSVIAGALAFVTLASLTTPRSGRRS
ncbi:hypothetical protein [Novosphingobium kaempferiae]|uniref:hypothetical protein n=1 Tax=Novosphingobium kaempferiae TaxID=2896849 RepID=UPI001E57265D|nr:hypothetical protein [Novosphingobium kaempferiae]